MSRDFLRSLRFAQTFCSFGSTEIRLASAPMFLAQLLQRLPGLTWYGGRPGSVHILLDGDPAQSPPPKKGHSLPTFRSMSICSLCCGQTTGCRGWIIKMPLSTEVCLCSGHIVLDGDPAPPKGGGAQHPVFRPCLL